MPINVFTSIARAVNRGPEDKLRILSFSVHEGFQTEMAGTGQQFIHVESPEGKMWDQDYRAMPHNIIEMGFENFMQTDAIDLVLSHTIPQREKIDSFCKSINVPHVCLMHCYPAPSWSSIFKEEVKQANKADWNVFTTEDSMREWGYSGEENASVIHHGIDLDHFSDWIGPGKDGTLRRILTVANDYRERSAELGYDRYEQIRAMFGEQGQQLFLHLGKSPDGWSNPAESYDKLAEAYKNCGVFLNTCHRSVLPTTLLEAMATGMPVVSASNPTISKLITNGENGFVTDNPEEMAHYLKIILENPELACKIGSGARESVSIFDTEIAAKSWNELFYSLILK